MNRFFALLVGALLSVLVLVSPTEAQTLASADSAVQNNPDNQFLLQQCKAFFGNRKYQGKLDWFEGENTVVRYEFRVVGLTRNEEKGFVYCEVSYDVVPVNVAAPYQVCGQTVTDQFATGAVAGYSSGRAQTYFKNGSILSFSPIPGSNVLSVSMKLKTDCSNGFVYKTSTFRSVE